MRIALVNPPPKGEFEKHWGQIPPLGLAYIASSLKAAGHEVRAFDGKLGGLDADTIVHGIQRGRFDMVGITAMTVEFPIAAGIAQAIKAIDDVPVVLGGVHVNAVKEEALKECTAFDFGCVGEGEYVVQELARAIGHGTTVEDIPGLLHRRGPDVIYNGKRPYPKDYDRLPFPAWDLFPRAKSMPIMTHRGCPFHCVSCGHNSGFRPRYRSADNVLAEIESLVRDFRPEHIRFEDETFGLAMVRTKEILTGIIARGLYRKVRFHAQTRVDKVDSAFVRLLKEANFDTLELGVESGNPDILREIKKGISLEQVEHAVGLARRHGLRTWCKFILGHPNETTQTVWDTIRFIARINPDRLSVSIMTPYPGTPIFEMAMRGEYGYRMLSAANDWQRFDKYSTGVLELDGLSLTKLKLLQIWAYANLYLSNWRFGELLRIVASHPSLARGLVMGVVTTKLTRRCDEAST